MPSPVELSPPPYTHLVKTHHPKFLHNINLTSAAFSLPVSSTDRMIDADPIMLDKN